jgi:uncharacterized OB-fold protein
MSETVKDDKIFIPGSKKNIVPFMRDVFTIPTNARQKPNLIGSICTECEEYFFPKTGQKATCDNPFCPRSTKETLLSGRGKILSATVMRTSVEGVEEERVSSVIMLEEGIKVNSPLIGWEGFQYLLVPGTPVEVILQEMGETDEGDVIVGYVFHLVTGRKKPQFPEKKEEAPKKGSRAKKVTAKKLPAKESSGLDAKKAAAPTPKKSAVKKSVKKKAAKKKVTKKVAKKKPAKKKVTKKAAKKKTIKKNVKKKAVKKKSPNRKSSAKKSAGKKKTSKKPKAKRR